MLTIESLVLIIAVVNSITQIIHKKSVDQEPPSKELSQALLDLKSKVFSHD